MDRNIIKAIEENDSASQEENTANETHKTLLIFDAGSRTYAADATKVSHQLLRKTVCSS